MTLSYLAVQLISCWSQPLPFFAAVHVECTKVWDLMEGDYTVISDIPSWVGVNADTLPPQVTYVGPLYGKLKQDVPIEVWQFRERATSEQQPLVWFAMGSSGQPPLVLAVLKQLLKQCLGTRDTERRVDVLTFGVNDDPQ